MVNAKVLILGVHQSKIEDILQKCSHLPVEIITRENYYSHDMLPICDFVIIRTKFVSHPSSARTVARARGATVVYHETRGLSTLCTIIESFAQKSDENQTK